MLGFTGDEERDEAYGLIGARRRTVSTTGLKICAIVGAVAVVGLLTSGRGASASMHGAAVLLAAKEADASPACATKPFGQCAGMNFTNGGAGYNFTGTAEEFACCPEGTYCLVMGPVWGMCMPSWTKPTATAASAESVFTALAQSPEAMAALNAAAVAARPKKQPEKKGADTKKEEVKKKEEPPAPAPEACTTIAKPYGQCAGMNMTQTKEERKAYNITDGAAAHPLACCPAGTSCVVFGPVWGMCMPTFGKPSA